MVSMLLIFGQILLLLASPFILVFLIYIVWLLKFVFVDKMSFKKSYSTFKEENVLKKMFWQFPRQWALDTINRDPNHFKEFGVHLVCGEQGSGKTIFVTWYLKRMQARYASMKVRTNYNYVYEDGPIETWKDIVLMNNGEYGEIDVIDEVQNWFSSNQSKDFPPEMLSEVSQQRKQRKMIMGTGQVFTRMAKPIREQARFVYMPFTVFGCLTIVPMYKPQLNDDASIKKMRLQRIFVIVQTSEVRNMYDTYKKIVDTAHSGFTERNWNNGIQTIVVEKEK